VEDKKFRLDLLHRLNTLHIHIPPLRERREDIEPLLVHFVDHYTKRFNKPGLRISAEVKDMLHEYAFPGNVRELRNMTERAIILCKGNTLGTVDFPIKPKKAVPAAHNTEVENLRSMEVNLVRKALQNNQYNQQLAADALGITRDALIRKMKKYSISIGKAEK
jgi:DNA-binding NtrC family response regulator